MFPPVATGLEPPGLVVGEEAGAVVGLVADPEDEPEEDEDEEPADPEEAAEVPPEP